MKRLVLFLTLTSSVFSQKYATQNGHVEFFSEAPMENIKATNDAVSLILDAATGKIAASVPIIEFQFAKKLMQEHFNEKYMETELYPKSTFSGELKGFNKDSREKQNVAASGKLTIHGVTQNVEFPGSIEITKDENVEIHCLFKVMLKDYNITIPKIVFYNIAEEIEVTLKCTLGVKS